MGGSSNDNGNGNGNGNGGDSGDGGGDGAGDDENGWLWCCGFALCIVTVTYVKVV